MSHPSSGGARGLSHTRAAPAKLNLYLHVTGRRPDGYHLLDSLTAFTELHDTVAVRPADRLTLSVEGPFAGAVEAGEDNLVLRAARRLAAAAQVEAGADIRLIKRVPVAAGLGGGSADAAAALAALDELWGLGLGAERLAALALEIGADVPVCLAGRAAFVGGIGEEIDSAPPLPPVPVLLVNPGVALSTAAVYEARFGPFNGPARFRDRPRDAAELAALLLPRHNDLTNAAVTLCPQVGKVLGALVRAPGCRLARMAGSGATCFGLFDNEAAARRAWADLRAAEPGWWVAETRLLDDTGGLAPLP